MNIRKKIIVSFSATSIVLTGIAFLFIYSLFSNYRTEEFQQRLKDKITTTLKFLIEVQQIDDDLLQTMDRYTINNLYQEKTLLFDEQKKLIYSGIDDTKILFSTDILNHLSPENDLIEVKEGDFDVVGVYIKFNNYGYYGINKAYDMFGYSKLNYLKYVLIFSFLGITFFILLITFYISKQISNPLNKMANEIENLKIDSPNSKISIPQTKDEINFLATRFNELMQRLNESFAFQKHAVHHISHELKTPIAILVSNFEKMEKENDVSVIQQMIKNQKEDTKNLSDIINALLEISKVDAGNAIAKEKIRIDELIYDIIEELKLLDKEYSFSVNISETIYDENTLTITANKKLIKLALVNLALNAVLYSKDKKAQITVSAEQEKLILEFINHGTVISKKETPFLFQHFFRGENSKGKRGFGLGLVLINKIIQIHQAEIFYTSPDNETNIFNIKLNHER